MPQEYSVWKDMKRRCNNPNSPIYKYYGGRGIKVCERWSDFESFLADMGRRPPGLSIERIDNNGDYEPENCKWATTLEQRRNQRAPKLTSKDVEKIRVMGLLGLPLRLIGDQFKVTKSHISQILLRRTWSHG